MYFTIKGVIKMQVTNPRCGVVFEFTTYHTIHHYFSFPHAHSSMMHVLIYIEHFSKLGNKWKCFKTFNGTSISPPSWIVLIHICGNSKHFHAFHKTCATLNLHGWWHTLVQFFKKFQMPYVHLKARCLVGVQCFFL